MSTTKIILSFLIGLLIMGSANANLTTYETRQELETVLPVTDGENRHIRPIYKVILPNLKVGDKILITYQFEVSSENHYPVGIGQRLDLDSINEDESSTIVPPVMGNISSHVEHHYVGRGSYVYTVTTEGKHTFYFSVYAVSNFEVPFGSTLIPLYPYLANNPGTIIIEQGYGFLQATVLN